MDENDELLIDVDYADENETIFENDAFKPDTDQIKKETKHLHEQQECNDWRASAKEFQNSREPVKLDFSRFFNNEWKTAKMAAKQLKFCPGESCRQWLPLFQFCENANTPDRLDVYCFTCNRRNRKKKIDKFEAFVMRSEDEALGVNVLREVDRRIMIAAKDAQRRYNQKFYVDKVDISRKLFLFKRFICCVTGSVLTPRCFLDHHSLTFQLSATDKNKIEIVASQCRICTPPARV